VRLGRISFAYLEVYGKKPEYHVACCMDEWQAGDGSGYPRLFPAFGASIPRGFVMDLIRIALILHIFFTTLVYS
jgi:hypothetical protein